MCKMSSNDFKFDNSLLMVGQFPPLVTGEAICNKHVFDISISCQKTIFMNTCIVQNAGDTGKLSLSKIFKSIYLWVRFIKLISCCEKVYITPGQTRFGLLRFIPFYLIASIFNKKVITHWHGYAILFLNNSVSNVCIRYIFKVSDVTILLTNDLLHKLKGLDIDISRCVVIHNFTNKLNSSSKNKFKIQALFLSSLMPEKGIYEFLDCVKQNPEINFVLCGKGSVDIENFIINTYGRLPNFNFKGVVSGDVKEKVFAETDVFILPTYYPTEGVPLALLEAMSAGCAVITTYHNGIPETLLDNGFYVAKKNSHEISHILSVLDENRVLLSEYQNKSAKRSLDFSYEKFKDQIISVIK